MCPPTSFDAVTTPRAPSLLAHRVGRGTNRQPILVAPGDQCNPSIGAQCRVGVGLREANALSGKPVKRWSSVISLTGAAQVGLTAVVDDDEQDVWPACSHPVVSGNPDL